MDLKKRISSMLILSLILIPLYSLASADIEYVALGDSIAWGNDTLLPLDYVADEGYVYSLEDYLLTHGPVTLKNNGYRLLPPFGYTSSELKSNLAVGAFDADLTSADIVTISIGANDLLMPFLDTMLDSETQNIFAYYKADPITYDLFLNSFAYYLMSGVDPNPIGGISAPLPPDYGVNNWGSSNFESNWPLIMGLLSSKALSADVYVITLYNPLQAPSKVTTEVLEGVADMINLSLPSDVDSLTARDIEMIYKDLYSVLNRAIFDINEAIKERDFDEYMKYKVVDVYRINKKEPVSAFNLFAAILNPTVPELLDPHPTSEGHEAIAEAHIKAMKFK